MNLTEKFIKAYLLHLGRYYWGNDLCAPYKFTRIEQVGGTVMVELSDGYYDEREEIDLLDLLTFVWSQSHAASNNNSRA